MARSSILALGMPKAWAVALGLWQAIFFSCLISHIGAEEVPDLLCHTDFDTEVVCHWDVTDMTDCAREFQLHVRNEDGRKLECVFENRTIPESASSSCVCVIHEKSFFGTKYNFSLVTRTNRSKEQSAYLSSIVKPRPLRNLTVTKSKRRSFMLAWKKSYDQSYFLYNQPVFCQIQISAEGQKQPDLRNLTEQTEHYEIFTDQLLPGKSHTVRIRYQMVDWGSFWSEWSSPCRWLNDFGPEPGDQLWWSILLVSFLVMALVSTCYCCLARLKRQWWDQIPSPKIADDLGKKPCPVPWQMLPVDEGKAPLCAMLQDLWERQISFMDSLPKDGAAFPGRPDKVAKMVPGSRPKGQWEVVLTPEVPFVEPSLTVCSPVAEPDPETPMEEEEDHVPRNNTLVNLFLDLLGGGDHTEDAETPEPVWEEPPPAKAPEPAPGGHCLLGGTPGKSLGGSSESGYRNSNVVTSSRAASPAPEQHQSDGQSFSSSQYKVLLFPQQVPSTPYRAVVTDKIGSQADSQKGRGATTPQPSCYKSFSSLVGQPNASFPQPWEHQQDFSRVDQAQPPSSWAPCREEALFSLPQQEAPSWNAPTVPCTVESCLPGYRPFGSASQVPSCLSLGSPYKPLLEAFRNVPKEGPLEPTLRTQEAGREAWQSAPWEEPLTFAFSRCMEEEEEDSGQEGVRQATEGFLPQVPVATL